MLTCQPFKLAVVTRQAAVSCSALPAVIRMIRLLPARLKGDPKYQFIVDPASGTYTLVAANTTLPPTDNKLVRQAINWTINRQRYTDTVQQALYGQPKDLAWPPTSPANDPAKQMHYQQNLDTAKALVQQAGAVVVVPALVLAAVALPLVAGVAGAAGPHAASRP